MAQSVLFLCPHGAAKSVLAAVYCQGFTGDMLAFTKSAVLRVTSVRRKRLDQNLRDHVVFQDPNLSGGFKQ